MYKKEEASKIKKEFWTAFGQYMKPIPSSEGDRINWINYKTGIKNISFKMQVDNIEARIGIEFSHGETIIRQLYFNQLLELKPQLQTYLGSEWNWQENIINNEGKIHSVVYNKITGVSVFKKDDWPKIISFLKKGIISLDAFWENGKYSFMALE